MTRRQRQERHARRRAHAARRDVRRERGAVLLSSIRQCDRAARKAARSA